MLLHGALGDAQLVGGLLVERAPHHLQQRLALFFAQSREAPAQLHKFLVRDTGLLACSARALDGVHQGAVQQVIRGMQLERLQGAVAHGLHAMAHISGCDKGHVRQIPPVASEVLRQSFRLARVVVPILDHDVVVLGCVGLGFEQAAQRLDGVAHHQPRPQMGSEPVHRHAHAQVGRESDDHAARLIGAGTVGGGCVGTGGVHEGDAAQRGMGGTRRDAEG